MHQQLSINYSYDKQYIDINGQISDDEEPKKTTKELTNKKIKKSALFRTFGTPWMIETFSKQYSKSRINNIINKQNVMLIKYLSN